MPSFTPTISEKICSSISEFCINPIGHNVKPMKIHAGVFNAYYLLVDAPDFSLMIRQVERTYHEAGQFKPDTHGFMCLSPGGSILYNGQQYERGHKLVTSGSEVSSILSSNLRVISCFIDNSLLNKLLIEEELEQFYQAVNQINQQSLRVSCDNTLSEYLYQLIFGLSDNTINIGDANAYHNLAENLYLHLFNYVTEHSADSYIDINPKKRIKILNDALAFIHDNEFNNITISDISHHVHTTQRNLQKLFDQNLGVSPKTYLLGRRLNHIHDELLSADPESTNIYDITKKYGVVHQGNFARSYLDFFGEYPNETLNGKGKIPIFERK